MRKILLGLAAVAAAFAFADFDGSYILPLNHTAIQYNTAPVTDRVAGCSDNCGTAKLKLEFDDQHGYLSAVLKALNVPVSSQVLVYSKTSFQAPRISPRMARALYFTDDVFVGWVPGGDVLEIASVDPRQGVVFYTMDQEAGSQAAYRPARRVPAMPRLGRNARRPGSDGAVGLCGAVGHAAVQCGRLRHGPSQPAFAALGRLVRDRHARIAASHGQRLR